MSQSRLDFGSIWYETRDGDPSAMALYRRHYSSRKNPNPKIYQFVGPGESIVLLTQDARALFVWRKFISDAGEAGVNCAVFRNEGTTAGQSSELIRAAIEHAWRKWPGERLYTYVDPASVRRKRDPGRCFRKAGFRVCGSTRKGLLILERLP